jgi:hypothetical protein
MTGGWPYSFVAAGQAGRLSQGSLGVGPPAGVGGEQVDDQYGAHVVVSAYLVEECLVCGDDDVEALPPSASPARNPTTGTHSP